MDVAQDGPEDAASNVEHLPGSPVADELCAICIELLEEADDNGTPVVDEKSLVSPGGTRLAITREQRGARVASVPGVLYTLYFILYTLTESVQGVPTAEAPLQLYTLYFIIYA